MSLLKRHGLNCNLLDLEAIICDRSTIQPPSQTDESTLLVRHDGQK